jgi:hypothetical protein
VGQWRVAGSGSPQQMTLKTCCGAVRISSGRSSRVTNKSRIVSPRWPPFEKRESECWLRPTLPHVHQHRASDTRGESRATRCAGALCAPNRTHRTHRRHRRGHLAMRCERAQPVARHRAPDPAVDPAGDRRSSAGRLDNRSTHVHSVGQDTRLRPSIQWTITKAPHVGGASLAACHNEANGGCVSFRSGRSRAAAFWSRATT